MPAPGFRGGHNLFHNLVRQGERHRDSCVALHLSEILRNIQNLHLIGSRSDLHPDRKLPVQFDRRLSINFRSGNSQRFLKRRVQRRIAAFLAAGFGDVVQINAGLGLSDRNPPAQGVAAAVHLSILKPFAVAIDPEGDCE